MSLFTSLKMPIAKAHISCITRKLYESTEPLELDRTQDNDGLDVTRVVLALQKIKI